MKKLKELSKSSLDACLALLPLYGCISLLISLTLELLTFENSYFVSYFVDNPLLDVLLITIVITQIFFAVVWVIAMLVQIRAYMLEETAEYRGNRLTFRELCQKNYVFMEDDDKWRPR